MAEAQPVQLSFCSAPPTLLFLVFPFPPHAQPVPDTSAGTPQYQQLPGDSAQHSASGRSAERLWQCRASMQINPINQKSQSTHKYHFHASIMLPCIAPWLLSSLTVYLHHLDWCNSNLKNVNQQHPISSSWESLKVPFLVYNFLHHSSPWWHGNKPWKKECCTKTISFCFCTFPQTAIPLWFGVIFSCLFLFILAT